MADAEQMNAEAPDLEKIRTPEHKTRMKAGRTIGRGVWLAGYAAEFPDATKEERNAALQEARKDFTKIGMKGLRALERNGFELIDKTAE